MFISQRINIPIRTFSHFCGVNTPPAEVFSYQVDVGVGRGASSWPSRASVSQFRQTRKEAWGCLAHFRPLPPTSAHFRLPCPPSVLAGAASPSPGVQSLSDHASSDQMLTYHPQLLPPHAGNGFSVTLVPVRLTIPSWLPFPAPNSSLMLFKTPVEHTSCFLWDLHPERRVAPFDRVHKDSFLPLQHESRERGSEKKERVCGVCRPMGLLRPAPPVSFPVSRSPARLPSFSCWTPCCASSCSVHVSKKHVLNCTDLRPSTAFVLISKRSVPFFL